MHKYVYDVKMTGQVIVYADSVPESLQIVQNINLANLDTTGDGFLLTKAHVEDARPTLVEVDGEEKNLNA